MIIQTLAFTLNQKSLMWQALFSSISVSFLEGELSADGGWRSLHSTVWDVRCVLRYNYVCKA